VGGAAALPASARYGDRHAAYARILDRAMVPSAGCSPATLGQVAHIVMFMHENRSFDHYFGTFHGVEGFGDGSAPVLRQRVPGSPGFVLPYHIDNNAHPRIFDIGHSWDPQHLSWNGGSMDAFAGTHLNADGPPGVITMGYYERADLAFYYALADAFTVCDHYHCSMIGPTDPNHLYWLSATLDPTGQHGGPLLETCAGAAFNQFTWTTMPEVLQEAGISWKLYGTQTFHPFGFTTDFVAYNQPGAFQDQGVLPSFEDFLKDAATGNLPQVSWVLGATGTAPAGARGGATTERVRRACRSPRPLGGRDDPAAREESRARSARPMSPTRTGRAVGSRRHAPAAVAPRVLDRLQAT